MNSMQLKDKLKNIASKSDINFNLILRNYMYERFIERLSISKYKNNFILKGGYYLSIVFGHDTRHTMDIDFCLKNLKLSENNVINIIEEIIEIDLNDGAIITFDAIAPIRSEDRYGGYRVRLTIKIDSVRESFNIDISTGDLITPREIVFKYKTLLNYKLIDLKSYNLETVLAEKLETILSKKDLSSRLKDYYDIYLIVTVGKDYIDKGVLLRAINNTFIRRGFSNDILETFNLIKNSDILKTRWNAYARKDKYANDIKYEQVMECLGKIIEVLIPVKI